MTGPRVALVGAGSMGRNHARIIAESPSAELALVIDAKADAARSLADAHGTAWATDLDGLSAVDAVVVAASTEHHYSITAEVLRAGLPVLVEKPVCPSLAQTLEILRQSEASGVPIMCGFLERYNPAYRNELAAFIEAVTKGKPTSPSGYDGLMAQRLADAATEARKAGKPVKL